MRDDVLGLEVGFPGSVRFVSFRFVSFCFVEAGCVLGRGGFGAVEDLAGRMD